MTCRHKTLSLTLAATLLLAATPAWTQGDRSADSPLASDSPLVELLLSQEGTREESARRLLQALEVAAFQPQDCVPGDEMFSDVPASSPFCAWVEELVRRGLTAGCADDRYCPSDPVSRQQMAVFLVRAIEAAIEDCSEGLAPDDEMVRVGSVCVDKYEASLWDAPVGGNQITGAIPCSETGQDCDSIYARSVAGVEPRGSITWFQAQAALANSGKRLPTNAEWQMAVRGTPDHPGPCNTDTGPAGVQDTGASAGCVSAWGVFDMVGNVNEWVADWIPRGTCLGDWPAEFGGDFQGICGAAESGEPGALLRGGDFEEGSQAGPFAVKASILPSGSDPNFGFRGAR